MAKFQVSFRVTINPSYVVRASTRDEAIKLAETYIPLQFRVIDYEVNFVKKLPESDDTKT
jgi:hypothetical protein